MVASDGILLAKTAAIRSAKVHEKKNVEILYLHPGFERLGESKSSFEYARTADMMKIPKLKIRR